jgi:inositol-phosphate phosphatase/L-galactose 1-phosphate phosphatase/histidinol-phosphatase
MSAVDFNAACVALAHRLADASGEIALKHFRTTLAVEDKADATSSPVTIADKDAETAMRELIRKTFPQHGIIGEEHGTENDGAEWVWVLDPIDGTQSFINGVPLFGTLIGLLHNGVPWFGCINHPALKQRWIGGEGLPTTMNGAPCRVRTCTSLSAATVYATGPEYLTADEATAFERLSAQVKKRRYGGTDCFHYAMVASGWTDMACEARLALHDFAAVVPVVIAAGGIVTDWTGNAVVRGASGHILASGDAAAHANALKALAWVA